VARIVDGAPSKLDSILYTKSQNYIVIYSKLYGTGIVKKEKINLTNSMIEETEEIDVSNWPILSHLNSTVCNGKLISWNASLSWIEITSQ